jgi:3-hydroxybutyryl-CoA dehydratase
MEIPELWWEDFAVGQTARSPGRTITEADLVAYAGLSGDFNQIHMDAVFSAEHGLGGERLVFGFLGLIVGSGLFTRTSMGIGMQARLIAMLGVEWSFKGPLRVGDTVHVEAEVVACRETSKPDRGLVDIRRDLINQRGELLQTGHMPALMRRRQPAS